MHIFDAAWCWNEIFFSWNFLWKIYRYTRVGTLELCSIKLIIFSTQEYNYHFRRIIQFSRSLVNKYLSFGNKPLCSFSFVIFVFIRYMSRLKLHPITICKWHICEYVRTDMIPFKMCAHHEYCFGEKSLFTSVTTTIFYFLISISLHCNVMISHYEW